MEFVKKQQQQKLIRLKNGDIKQFISLKTFVSVRTIVSITQIRNFVKKYCNGYIFDYCIQFMYVKRKRIPHVLTTKQTRLFVGNIRVIGYLFVYLWNI